MASVTALDPLPRDPSLCRVSVDGTPVGVLLRSEAEKIGAKVGAAWTPRLSRFVERAIADTAAYGDALKMLGAKSMSEAMVTRKLIEKGHDKEAATRAVQRLVSDDWIDDRGFATERARTLLAKGPLAHLRLVALLVEEGVPEPIAEEVAEKAAPPGNDLRAAVAFAREASGGEIKDARTARRIATSLGKAGFETDVVTTALRRLGYDATGEVAS